MVRDAHLALGVTAAACNSGSIIYFRIGQKADADSTLGCIGRYRRYVPLADQVHRSKKTTQ
jgi:hypothetical protein